MIRRPPRSTQSRSSAASDVYKRQIQDAVDDAGLVEVEEVDVDVEEHEAGPCGGELGLHGDRRGVEQVRGFRSDGHRLSFQEVRFARRGGGRFGRAYARVESFLSVRS